MVQDVVKHKKILFVCYGNVARSQMAEAYYNKLSNSNDALSAGVSSGSIDRYKHPTSDIVKIMLEDGIDLSKNDVKKVSPEMVNHSDIIVVMCDLDDCPSYLINSKKVKHIPIPDPYSIGVEYARSVRDEIKRMVLGLMSDGSKK